VGFGGDGGGNGGAVRAWAPEVTGLQTESEVDLSAVQVPAGMGVFIRVATGPQAQE